MQQGHDAPIVSDELTQHAKAYCVFSLFLRRPSEWQPYPSFDPFLDFCPRFCYNPSAYG